MTNGSAGSQLGHGDRPRVVVVGAGFGGLEAARKGWENAPERSKTDALLMGFAIDQQVPVQKAFAGPLPQVRFCPTGGITPATAPRYLELDNVACVGGSWLTPPGAIAAQDWRRIEELAAAARRA